MNTIVPLDHLLTFADRKVKTTFARGLSLRAGFSLLELLVVLAILMATAVLIMPLFNPSVVAADGTSKSANEISTQTSMKVIREVLVGEQGVLENMANRPNALPREIAELVQEEAPQHIQAAAPDLSRFNPFAGIGWRGPYLSPTGKNRKGQPTLVDGWGREFMLQVDFDSDGDVDDEEVKYIRVVSAGPNGEIETPLDPFNMRPGTNEQSLTLDDCGDDLVMFFSVPDIRQ